MGFFLVIECLRKTSLVSPVAVTAAFCRGEAHTSFETDATGAQQV